MALSMRPKTASLGISQPMTMPRMISMLSPHVREINCFFVGEYRNSV
jgi:hypothetical protein